MSLRLKLLLALVPLFVAGLAVANVVTYVSLRSFLTSRIDDQLLSSHGTVEASLLRGGQPLTTAGTTGGGGAADNGGEGGGTPPNLAIPPGTYGVIRTPSGSIVAGPQIFAYDSATSAAPVLPSALPPGTDANPSLLTVDGTGGVSTYRLIVETVRNGSGDVLVVGIPLDDVGGTLTRLLVIELAVSGAVVLLMAATTLLIVRRSLRPLVRIGRTAQSIAASDLETRVSPADDRTEIGRLGVAINAMLGRLEESFAEREASQQRLRDFVSDASHELRTPLTSMRGYAELLRRRPDLTAEEVALSMRRIQEQTERMGVLVDDLLLLARLDQGRALEHSPVDLVAIVAEARDDARAIDPDRPVEFHAPDQLTVVGDGLRLRHVVGNLVRNAIVHTPPGTALELWVRAEGERAILEVVDHGPGIPAGQSGQIFDRFHRADPKRSRDRGGSGLGLSIVAAVVEAHGGSVTVVGTQGGGATFRVSLPLVAGAAEDRTARAGIPEATRRQA